MDIFWQITLVEALLNVAIFAIAVIVYGLLKGEMAKSNWTKAREDCVIGSLLGIATGLALLLPIHISGGAALGCQSILIAFAGALAGPAGALSAVGMAAITILATRTIFDISVGAVDILAILGASAGGLGVAWLVHRVGRRALSYVDLPLLALASAASGLVGLWILDDFGAVAASVWPTLAANLFATGVLGTLLLHEVRRGQAERDVRINEAHLREANEKLIAKAHELSLAWEKAEQLSQAKSQFLAMMSHELRTPLNAVIGFAHIIRDKMLGEQSDQYSEYAGDIANSGQHLLDVISDILEFSRAEAGTIELNEEPVDLCLVIEDCRRMLHTRAKAKGITLTSRVRGHLPVFRGDERRVRQIVLNLASNAVKFTPEGGTVVMSARQSAAGSVELIVEDTGIGIPESDLYRVLEPFYQVDGRLSRAQEGTGLGLPLSKHLAELHEATLSLRNREGGGLTARVAFPAGRIVPQPANDVVAPVLPAKASW